MSRFEPIDPKALGEDGIGMVAAWGILSPEPVMIAVHGYAFGQYRIQCQIQRGRGYPWILSPEC